MPSHQHNTLVEQIQELTLEPSDPVVFERWVAAAEHIAFLDRNAQTDELIVFASGPHCYVRAVSISRDILFPLNQEELLDWSDNQSEPRAFYDSESSNPTVWITKDHSSIGSKPIKQTQQLIFIRHFDGLRGEPSYCEVLQEYLHLSEIHWRHEHSSFCRFDENGDFDHVVSVTQREDPSKVTLVSFKREPLELYLAASNSVLLRKFDFTLFRRNQFSSWPDEPETVHLENSTLFYKQRIDPGIAGYAKGIQIVHPSRPDHQIFSLQQAKWFGNEEESHVEFEAYDWRNNRDTFISTDPSATTNYFVAHENSLPYETSLAFFRPEVLAKYKGDSDKYVVDEASRTISCRNLWELRRFDVNEAGQVHAYICYLRDIPYEEQLYWRSFNETRKGNISERALEHDILGRWQSIPDPLTDVLSVVEKWDQNRVGWWKLRDRSLPDRVTTPYTPSRDEWAQAFMDFSQLIVEGFVLKAIRRKLDSLEVAYDQEKSIALLEKLLAAKSLLPKDQELEGLRTTNLIRTKTKAHSGSTQAYELAANALRSHDSYANHFRHVCKIVMDELSLIQQAFVM